MYTENMGIKTIKVETKEESKYFSQTASYFSTLKNKKKYVNGNPTTSYNNLSFLTKYPQIKHF